MIRTIVFAFSLLCNVLLFLLPAQEYCKYKREGDCIEERSVKVSGKRLADFLMDLRPASVKKLDNLFIYGKLENPEDYSEIADLPIEDLTFRKTQLEKVPDWVYSIENLEKLDLGDNYIQELSPSLCSLSKLRELILWVNDIYLLPFCVNEMVELRTIDMTGIKMNEANQRNLSNSFRAVKFLFSEPCMCNFQDQP
ncbi:MAG: hypothetical protein ACPF8V_12050 [Luteibaculum sp.]